ncbi:MAG: 23S rRNA (guanosine(2251)-2'-O)-methyltransferase RlmB [Bacteroidota bacterium]
MMAKQQIIFGLHSLQEALDAGENFEKVMMRKELDNEQARRLQSALRKARIPVQYVPAQRLDRITRKNHQGVVAFISPIEYTDVEMLIPKLFDEGKSPFLLILDGVTDVRNFGSICRTAECAGVDAVIVPNKGAAQISADAIKTSAGALSHIPVCRADSLGRTIDYLKDSGLTIVAASEKTTAFHFNFDFTAPLALILGSEDKGISGSLMAKADAGIRIPINGKINSLNVSNAAAIIVYEAVRQRMINNGNQGVD